MKALIVVTALTSLLSGAVFAQSSNTAHNAHRFVSNASVISHVNAATHEQNTDEKNKDTATPFSEMNEHEGATIAHSFMNNSASYPRQKMIKEHKKTLNESETNTKSLSFSELNAGEKAALIHESVNNAGAEAHQIQVKKLRELYESDKQ